MSYDDDSNGCPPDNNPSRSCCDACGDSELGPTWRTFRGLCLCTTCHRLAFALSAFDEHCRRLNFTAELATSIIRNLSASNRLPLAQSCVVCLQPAHHADQRGSVCALCLQTPTKERTKQT